MNKAFVIFIKDSEIIELFGSLKELFKKYSHLIEKKIDTLYHWNFYKKDDENNDIPNDYSDRFVRIAKREIQRSKHSDSSL